MVQDMLMREALLDIHLCCEVGVPLPGGEGGVRGMIFDPARGGVVVSCEPPVKQNGLVTLVSGILGLAIAPSNNC